MLLGSRVWDPNATIDGTEPEGVVPPLLGESRSAPHRWDSGALPVSLPNRKVLGSLDCLANGARLADAIPLADTRAGFPIGCFGKGKVPNPDFDFAASVWVCETQCFWASLLYALSTQQYNDLRLRALARFPGSSVSVSGRSKLYPAFAWINHPEYVCLLADGSDTLSVVILQAIGLVKGPQSFGPWSTGNLWYSYAQTLLQTLKNQALLDGRPIVLVGYSYGGAAVLLLAALIRAFLPLVEIRYLTFGAPKPGDARLTEFVRAEFSGLSLVTDGDYLTAVPPAADVIAGLTPFLGRPNFLNWTMWTYPPETTLLRGADVLKNTYQVFDSSIVTAIIRQFPARIRIKPPVEHQLASYIAAIARRCTCTRVMDLGQVIGGSTPIKGVIPLGQVLGANLGPPGISTPCCPAGMPFTLRATVTGAGPPNGVWLGQSWTFDWDASLDQWRTEQTIMGTHFATAMQCLFGSQWFFALSLGLTFTGTSMDGCSFKHFLGSLTSSLGTGPASIMVDWS